MTTWAKIVDFLIKALFSIRTGCNSEECSPLLHSYVTPCMSDFFEQDFTQIKPEKTEELSNFASIKLPSEIFDKAISRCEGHKLIKGEPLCFD